MKKFFTTTLLTSFLLLGFWSLFSTPARANVLCLVDCVNQRTDCIIDVRLSCLLIGQGTFCATVGEFLCASDYRRCTGNCGICPI